MKNKIIMFFIIFCFIKTQSFTQGNYELDGSIGWVYTDIKSTYNRVKGHYSYNLKNDLNIWRTFNEEKKFRPRFGVGYSHIWSLLGGIRVNANYLTLNAGIDMKMNKKSELTGYINRYYLLNKNPDRVIVNSRERKSFFNLDLGVRFNLSNRTQMALTTPITLTPMYYGKFTELTTLQVEHTVWVGMVGVNFGFSYIF